MYFSIPASRFRPLHRSLSWLPNSFLHFSSTAFRQKTKCGNLRKARALGQTLGSGRLPLPMALTGARRPLRWDSFALPSLNLFANKILILSFRLERALHLQFVAAQEIAGVTIRRG